MLDWITADADFTAIGFRGTCTWSPRGLACAALLWTWSDEDTLVERFAAARKVALVALGLDEPTAASYQAFTKLLRGRTAALVLVLVLALRHRMQRDLAGRFTVAGFAAFGVDGSRLQLPRAASNEGRFSSPPKRKSKSKSTDAAAEAARRKMAECPQMWLTTTYHLGTGLPWDWRTGPTDSSERAHLRQMLDALPSGALVVADAGFVGYETWEAILAGGRHLLVRVGANVRLLRGLGDARERDGLVYLWPDEQAARGRPPLVLRLVVAQGPRHPVYLDTSALEETTLSDRQVVGLYRLRWGVEVFYRSYKQTMQRRKLLSRRAGTCLAKALGLWLLELMTVSLLIEAGTDPLAMSVAGARDAVRRALRESRPRRGPRSLAGMLRAAVKDRYIRHTSKAAHNYPRKKREKPPGPPKIKPATKAEVERARKLPPPEMPLRWTA